MPARWAAVVRLLAGLQLGIIIAPLNAATLDASYDLLIENARVLDGTGNPWFAADLGIRDARIVAIGSLADHGARERLDVAGAIVAPGFIDLHSHADDFSGAKSGLRSRDLDRRRAANIVTQGVTTVVVNPDGSAQPGLTIAAQRKALESPGVGLNVALMAAHNAIRFQVMGLAHERPATADQIDAMQKLVDRAMQQGAFGLSSGLEYVPGRFSRSDELVMLMNTVRAYSGVHISHIRSETSAPMWWVPSTHMPGPPQLLDAIREVIAIAERSRTVGVITHMKVRGTTHWGQSADVIELVNAARDRGVEVYGDQYPYPSSGSDGELVLIPPWARKDAEADGATDYARHLKSLLRDGGNRERLEFDIRHAIAFRGGAQNIVVFDAPNAAMIGRNLAELAAERNISAIEMAVALQLDGYRDRPGGVRLRSFSLSEKDMIALMQQPWVATASDGGVALPADGPAVHARYYGTFPRKIARYVRQEGALGLADAVRKATGLPAQILKLDDRGVIRVGAVADLVVFDPDTITDQATFTEPHQFSSGISHVLIGGDAAVRDGQATGALIGQVLRRGGT